MTEDSSFKLLSGRNVNHLYSDAIHSIKCIGEPHKSRAGDVLVAPYPVWSLTELPCERVLFDPQRDANPFFHLFECIWMMDGRRDATWLDRFVSNFSKCFAQSNGDNWGAYGHRWRYHFGECQLDDIVNKLISNHLDRRVVLTMWDPRVDLWPSDYTKESIRDHPCNTHIYPRIVDGALDLTVCCRSNDIIWGAYGANSVHFSFLLEYLAGRIGVNPGRLYQLSNNWHAYTSWHNDEQRLEDAGINPLESVGEPTEIVDPYSAGQVSYEPIGNNWDEWDIDCSSFLHWIDENEADPSDAPVYSNDWFRDVAQPMYLTHLNYKMMKRVKEPNAAEAYRLVMIQSLNDIKATDWQLAASEWIERRM